MLTAEGTSAGTVVGVVLIAAALLIVMVTLITLVPVSMYLARRRQRDDSDNPLVEFAAVQGWNYLPFGLEPNNRWRGFPFGLGDDRSATDVIRGELNGHRFVSFTYRWTDRDGENSVVNVVTVCAFELPSRVPQLVVANEYGIQRFSDSLGLTQDLQFESEEFNRRFRVRSEDAKFAVDVMNPRTMELLLRSPLTLRTEASDLLAWTSGSSSPANVTSLVYGLAGVVANVPRFNWSDGNRVRADWY